MFASQTFPSPFSPDVFGAFLSQAGVDDDMASDSDEAASEHPTSTSIQSSRGEHGDVDESKHAALFDSAAYRDAGMAPLPRIARIVGTAGRAPVPDGAGAIARASRIITELELERGEVTYPLDS